MKFIFPSQSYEQKAIDFIKEFHNQSSEVNGDGGLEYFLENSTYSDWLAKLMRDIDIANIPKDKVPQFTYFYVTDDEEKIIGAIAIRLATNDLLKKRCGHIGYCIRPTERRKGYATKMLGEAIKFCRKINLSNFVIICDKSNSASIGVVKKCGGVLIDEFYSDEFQETEQMYCIE